MRTLILGAIFALHAVFAFGTAFADTPASYNPVLRASVGGVRSAINERPFPMKKLDIAIVQRGSIAETTITAVFAHAGSQPIEGTFRMRLPVGAIITRYALNIGDTMVDGVLVDRPRAKAVYEARVRQRIDPGFADVAADGAFSTRIFPVTAAGRTIRLTYVAPVDPVAGLILPLGFDAPTDGWHVNVLATGLQAAPSVRLPNQALQIVADGTGWRGTAQGKDALSGTLLLKTGRPTEVLVSRHASGERFVQLTGDLPGSTSPGGGRLRVYWDRARGARDADHAAAIKAVTQLIAATKPASIELVAFNSSGVIRKPVPNATEAGAWLQGLQYRGARSLAGIEDKTDADTCLIVTDGPPTIDREAQPAFRCTVDVLSTSATPDLPWLRHFASLHGGRVIRDGNVLGGRAGVRSVADRDGKKMPFVTLDGPTGQWRIVARAPAGGPLTVRTDRLRTIVLPTTDDVAFDGEGAVLAADMLTMLGAADQRAAFVETSRRYSVASPSLAFLVLETPNDYIAAEIAPPTNYPTALRDDYWQMRKSADGRRRDDDAIRLLRVVNDWNAQTTWWKTKFDPNAKPKRVATSENFDRTTSESPSQAMMMPPPPPPPAPVAQASGGRSDEVAVTARRRESLTEGASNGPGIQVDAWQPDRPYLELYDGKPTDFDARFVEAEARHGTIPAFYLDTANWLFKRGNTAAAIEMVLSTLDLAVANDVTLGIVAARLERYGAIDRSIELRERHAAIDPDRPQPQRLLALALARRAGLQAATARTDLDRAIRLLGAVAVKSWTTAWDGIDMIALMDANTLVPRLRALGGKPGLDPRLIALLDTDIRVTIDWTTDATDIDLWVDEPTRERAIYNNPRTAIGGHLSNDMTQGYGPEEYLIRRAVPGTYVVQANVYAPDRLDPNGASVMTAHIFRDFGRANQSEETVDIELDRDEKGSKMIGRIVIPAPRGGVR